MTAGPDPRPAAERHLDAVRGTRDWLPQDHARLAGLESLLLDRFARAGYTSLRTPVLEPTELHERKSGAGIISRLFEVSVGGSGSSGVCLRPELTAGIVRAYTGAEVPPTLPWRVSHSGPVFRYETPRPGRLREFLQVGIERLGDGGPHADAEVIWLADWALREAGVTGVTIRIGHVGLILEMLSRSGLPAPLASALVEMLSEAAADGQGVRTLESGLDQLSGWLRAEDTAEIAPEVDRTDDSGIDRLFRTLVPVVTGRRTGHEIIHRLRRKWDLGHGLLGSLERVREQVHALADRAGSPPEVLASLGAEGEASAPESVSSIRALMSALNNYGIGADRLVLDLGFGRGIGFYSQVVFELSAGTPAGPVEIGGGGRYDGLARVLGSDRDDRGVGFAFGLERLAGVLEAQQAPSPPIAPKGILLLAADESRMAEVVALAARMRARGVRAVVETGLAVDDAMLRAETAGLAWMIVVEGPGKVTMRDLVTLVDQTVSLNEAEALPLTRTGR